MSDPDTPHPTDSPAPPPPPPPPPRGPRRRVLALQVLALTCVVALWLWKGRPQEPVAEPLPMLGELPEFRLVDASGTSTTLADLRGSVWIADFIFTRCGGQCLEMTGRMRELRQALETDTNVRLVSISVNPTYDTPERLTDYAQRHGAVTDQWLFLTGSRDAVYGLANGGFKLGAMEATEEQQADGADMFLHSVRFVLVDAEGSIRGYYSSTDSAALHRLLADARRLARGPAA